MSDEPPLIDGVAHSAVTALQAPAAQGNPMLRELNLLAGRMTGTPGIRTKTKAASLADDLVQRFEQQIADGGMPPGSRFPSEKAITEDFGVSRTVVREAFARLAARGLLVSRRGSGAYVAEDAQYRGFEMRPVAEIEDVIRLLEMRMGFEVEMADLAARRRTEEDLAEMRRALAAMEESADVDGSVKADAAFHSAIARATGNDYFTRFTEFLGVRLVPSRRLSSTPCLRSAPRCWEVPLESRSSWCWSSPTVSSPSRSSSSIRTRTGWPSVRKNSALTRWIGAGPTCDRCYQGGIGKVLNLMT